jgi:hypothetical protein
MTEPKDLPLRDIHLPGEIPFWPPAPGWWILTALIIAAIAGGIWLYRHQRMLKLSATRMAHEQLQVIVARYQSEQDPQELLQQLSVLLRRLSISLFPRTEVASLTGQAWLEFLDRQTAQPNFSSGSGRLLSEAPYRRTVDAAEAEQVLQYCQQWIEAVAKGKRR